MYPYLPVTIVLSFGIQVCWPLQIPSSMVPGLVWVHKSFRSLQCRRKSATLFVLLIVVVAEQGFIGRIPVVIRLEVECFQGGIIRNTCIVLEGVRIAGKKIDLVSTISAPCKELVFDYWTANVESPFPNFVDSVGTFDACVDQFIRSVVPLKIMVYEITGSVSCPVIAARLDTMFRTTPLV